MRPGMYRDEAFKLKTVNGVKTHRPLLADDGLEDIKLCMLSLDQGSIGSAGVAFASFLLFMTVMASFDKLHRLVRDLKLSIAAAAGGIFLKAQLYSNNIWSLNAKPWGTGLFWSLKKRQMDVFFNLVKYTEDIFYNK